MNQLTFKRAEGQDFRIDAAALKTELAALNLPGLDLRTAQGEATVTVTDESQFYTHEEPAVDSEGKPVMLCDYVEQDGVGKLAPTTTQATTRERRVKPEVVDAITACVNAHIAAAPKRENNANIERQILALEATVTPRMLRASAVGDAAGVAKLQGVESAIAALRAQRL